MDKEYIIKINNSDNNSYLEPFFREKGLLIRKNDNEIVIRVNNIISLENYINEGKFLKLDYLDNFIYDMGYQLLMMKKNNKSILNISISDIKIINEEHFLYLTNGNQLTLYNDFISIPPLKLQTELKDKRFLSPELIKLIEQKGNNYYTNIYYTNIYYSLSKIILYSFNINLESIYYSKPYFFLKRCLNENPLDRDFLYI